MGWIVDLFKEVPTVAVARERAALAEEKFAAVERERDSLKRRCAKLEEENEALKIKLTAVGDDGALTRKNGLLWKKLSDGSYEEAPYCPKCQLVMYSFPPQARDTWDCNCGMTANWCQPPKD